MHIYYRLIPDKCEYIIRYGIKTLSVRRKLMRDFNISDDDIIHEHKNEHQRMQDKMDKFVQKFDNARYPDDFRKMIR